MVRKSGRNQALLAVAACALAGAAAAAPKSYLIEPGHTYPSFKASHRGLSFWHGKFDRTSGKIVLDREAGTGQVDISVDTTSVDFGLAIMNKVAQDESLFNVAKYPTATFKSDSVTFAKGVPVTVNGQFTLLGVTKPLRLDVVQFKCEMHPVFKREICGADVQAKFNRTDFGMTREAEHDPMVYLEIQVEALEGNELPAMPPPGGPPAAGAPPK